MEMNQFTRRPKFLEDIVIFFGAMVSPRWAYNLAVKWGDPERDYPKWEELNP